MTTEDRHFTHSTLRERIVEHVFVGDILRTLGRLGVTDVEVLRPEFDAHGYDVVSGAAGAGAALGQAGPAAEAALVPPRAALAGRD
jgi:hypothetical protein